MYIIFIFRVHENNNAQIPTLALPSCNWHLGVEITKWSHKGSNMAVMEAVSDLYGVLWWDKAGISILVRQVAKDSLEKRVSRGWCRVFPEVQSLGQPQHHLGLVICEFLDPIPDLLNDTAWGLGLRNLCSTKLPRWQRCLWKFKWEFLGGMPRTQQMRRMLAGEKAREAGYIHGIVKWVRNWGQQSH